MHCQAGMHKSWLLLRWTEISGCCLMFLVVIPTPTFATDHFNLESGIPTTIEDIEPIERGRAEFRAFGRFSRLREEKKIGEAEPLIAVGIFDKTQLEIAAPFDLGEGAADGNGDVLIRRTAEAPGRLTRRVVARICD